jgi:hypothetical protein
MKVNEGLLSQKLEVLVNFNSRDWEDPCKEGANRLAGVDKRIFVALSKIISKTLPMMDK